MAAKPTRSRTLEYQRVYDESVSKGKSLLRHLYDEYIPVHATGEKNVRINEIEYGLMEKLNIKWYENGKSYTGGKRFE